MYQNAVLPCSLPASAAGIPLSAAALAKAFRSLWGSGVCRASRQPEGRGIVNSLPPGRSTCDLGGLSEILQVLTSSPSAGTSNPPPSLDGLEANQVPTRESDHTGRQPFRRVHVHTYECYVCGSTCVCSVR